MKEPVLRPPHTWHCTRMVQTVVVIFGLDPWTSFLSGLVLDVLYTGGRFRAATVLLP